MNKTVDDVLPADSGAKLLRVFCFLRQHERKTRIAKKTAEMMSWRPPQQPQEQTLLTEEQASPSETLDEADLVAELDLLTNSKEPQVVDKSVVADSRNALKTISPTVQEIRNEIKELQKGVITSNSDTSGVIAAADLSSCMKSLNRVPSKGEAQWMIWEIDDDLDGCVSWEEFKSCYTRTLLDSNGLEPNQLYYLIQFLICDTDGSQTVSADEITAELQRIGGTEHLTAKLWSFLESENEEQQLLRKMTLSEFLDAMSDDLPASFKLH